MKNNKQKEFKKYKIVIHRKCFKRYKIVIRRKCTIWEEESHIVYHTSKREAIKSAINGDSYRTSCKLDFDSYERMEKEDNKGRATVKIVEAVVLVNEFKS